jgi:hypothetical protein
MASADGGRTWQQQHTPIESTLFGVRFLDVNRLRRSAIGLDDPRTTDAARRGAR